MLTYDIIAYIYPAAFAATRGITSHEDTNHPHRPRLSSLKKPQSHSSSEHPSNQHKNRRQSLQHEYGLIPDFCDTPAYDSCVDSSNEWKPNPEYNATNNNQTDILDLNQLKSVSKAIPISAYPKSLIQWPVDGSTKNKRISEVKKQVKLLGNFIKMTVGGGHHAEALSDDKTPTNPPPFSGHVDMSRIPVHNLAHTADETSMAKWEDIEALIQAGRMKEAKYIVRETDWSLGSPARENLWREICRHHSSEKDFGDYYYWDTVKQIYGTTELLECSVQLPAFIDTKYKISQSLSPRGVTACERVISVIAFSHPAITYAPALYAMTSLLLHYMDEVDAYNCMAALVCGAQNKFLTQTKIANEAHWRAAVILGKKHIRGAFSTLSKFGVPEEQIEDAFQNWIWWILAALPITHVISPQKLLKTAFGIRAFSKSEITKVVVQTEMYLKSQRVMGGTGSGAGQMHAPETPTLNRSVSLEGLPTSESQSSIQMMSHTLTIKELLTLWSWLPMRMTMHQPTLLYTTEEHGCSLTTFFQRVEKHEPTLLCIRTVDDYVFGAYCSTAWIQRHHKDEFGNWQTYFGTGETFLFTMRPTVAKYQWVGISRQQNNAELSSVEHSAELFMHADHNMITIGGGNGQGIMLDHDFRYGKTETCQTFDNPPLVPNGDFEVKVIEVYSLINM
nr:GTPase-activating protein skywalker-like isoform X3 [Cherax quadricarinatus]